MRLHKSTSVRSYAPADTGAYTFCIVAERGGFAFYDSASGTVSNRGYGHACKA